MGDESSRTSDQDAPSSPAPAGEPGGVPARQTKRPIPDALLTALTTDQFVLQSAATTTVNEAVGRSSLYISALSSSLVALGFATSRPSLLTPLVILVIPTVFVLGLFTIARLVDTGIANIAYLAQIARIRERYAAIDDEGPEFFPSRGDKNDLALQSLGGSSSSRFNDLFTVASMVATVNAIVGGVGVGLLVRLAAPSSVWLWVGVGAVGFVAFMAAFLRYQRRRHDRSRR